MSLFLMTMEKMNGEKLPAQRLLKKWAVTVVLYWELERIYLGVAFR